METYSFFPCEFTSHRVGYPVGGNLKDVIFFGAHKGLWGGVRLLYFFEKRGERQSREVVGEIKRCSLRSHIIIARTSLFLFLHFHQRRYYRFVQNVTPPFLSNVHVLRPSEPGKNGFRMSFKFKKCKKAAGCLFLLGPFLFLSEPYLFNHKTPCTCTCTSTNGPPIFKEYMYNI